VIKSFKHKGLKKYFYYGDISGIQPEHRNKLTRLLTAIDESKVVDGLKIPGFCLHQLKGDYKDLWSVKVNGNWRITFKFEKGDAYILDYQDYH